MFKNVFFFIYSDGLLAFQQSYKELSVQAKNDHGYLNDEPPADSTAAPGTTESGVSTTTATSGTTTPSNRFSVILSLASLLPVLIVNMLKNN